MSAEEEAEGEKEDEETIDEKRLGNSWLDLSAFTTDTELTQSFMLNALPNLYEIAKIRLRDNQSRLDSIDTEK